MSKTLLTKIRNPPVLIAHPAAAVRFAYCISRVSVVAPEHVTFPSAPAPNSGANAGATNAVVAIFVDESPADGVGAVGVPVNAGELSGAPGGLLVTCARAPGASRSAARPRK